MLETLEYIRHQTDTWLELTTLLIPGENDSEQELQAMTAWVVEHLGPDVPMHFTAFHPDWKMRKHANTAPATLKMARQVALANGVRFAYTGNVRDPAGASTWCPDCGELLIERDWHRLGRWGLDAKGCCGACGAAVPGVFGARPDQLQTRPQRVILN